MTKEEAKVKNLFGMMRFNPEKSRTNIIMTTSMIILFMC